MILSSTQPSALASPHPPGTKVLHFSLSEHVWDSNMILLSFYHWFFPTGKAEVTSFRHN